MKILFVTRGFPSNKDPMSGNYEAVQAKAIAALGHEVSVIAIRWWNLAHPFKSLSINLRIVEGVQVYECNGYTIAIPHVYSPRLELYVREKQFRRVFNRYINERGMPDVVHAHIVTMAYPALFLKKELNIPFVITEHWSAVNKEHINKRISYQVKSYSEADQIICVSEVLAKSLKKKFDVNSIVINNMVNDLFFKNRKIIRNDNEFKFIAVGALKEIKRFDLLVDAFALAHLPRNISLDIVGDGQERFSLKKRINSHGLDNQVRLLGLKSPDEVCDLMCQSDCLVLSSQLETFSIVLIEAMAKGLPVIATKCGGPDSFVRSEDGILVPKDNVEELSKAMKYMTQHYHRYDTDEIRQHCYDNFSQDVIANKIIEVYKQVIGK